MTTKLVVGPIDQGLRTNRLPFNIDNDSFPTLINAYQWRGRVKRKRGTSLLTRLRRFFNSNSTSYSSVVTINLVAGSVNLLTGFGLQSTGSIIPGTVSILDTVSGDTYTDPGMDGTLVGNPAGSGTINYGTGVITIVGVLAHAISAIFSYYPTLPVMGLREFIRLSIQFPGEIAFDTKYSYNIQTAFPYAAYDVSFYKNPIADPTLLPGYTPKSVVTPLTWNGADYQQFWTVTYQGAMWATNGIRVPFDPTNLGMQFKPITGVTIITAGNGTNIPAVADITILAHGLVQGDFVFINEVNGITGINWQTGYVTSADPQAANLVRVTFPIAILGGAYTNNGIAQYLTNRSNPAIDNIRWYDGDPTNGNVTTPSLTGSLGWVNFMPPLSQAPFSIAELPPDIYYLVGARMIVPFKDRLLFLGPVIQSSSKSPIYLPDTVIFSQNGTPYYTASWFDNIRNPPDPRIPVSISPVLVPVNQTAFAAAYFEDSIGFGGFRSSGLDEQILTVSTNEDVLIIGFNTNQTRFVYTGNDLQPFDFYLINSELGSSSTFSAINMDKGVITRGSRGYIITGQTSAERVDVQIPDQVFQIRLTDNGPERITAARDFVNEWVYFTYPSNQLPDPTYKFPTETLLFNYRDNSWAIFRECYTTYGTFRRQTGFTWDTVGLVYPTWDEWNDPWDAGTSTLLNPEVLGGNQQGFVLTRADGTGEGNSLAIQSISGNTITSPDHCLSNQDYIIISGAIGTIDAEINNRIFSVSNATQNTFVLNPSIEIGTYFGGGLIKRMYVPFIQTKQFPIAWQDARKTRIGVQRYLLTRTNSAEIQLLIFLSQNSASAYNMGPIVPAQSSINDSLIYGTTLFTCPESTNLGLTPANVNLMTPTAQQQDQIWHRINTSLIGDTVQLGFTMSDAQMRAFDVTNIGTAITGASQTDPCVLDCTAQFPEGQLITITGVEGMVQLNGNTYFVLSSSPTQVTIDVDATGFTAYDSGGIATPIAPVNQFAEIELHGFILDVSESQMLV